MGGRPLIGLSYPPTTRSLLSTWLTTVYGHGTSQERALVLRVRALTSSDSVVATSGTKDNPVGHLSPRGLPGFTVLFFFFLFWGNSHTIQITIFKEYRSMALRAGTWCNHHLSLVSRHFLKKSSHSQHSPPPSPASGTHRPTLSVAACAVDMLQN